MNEYNSLREILTTPEQFLEQAKQNYFINHYNEEYNLLKTIYETFYREEQQKKSKEKQLEQLTPQIQESDSTQLIQTYIKSRIPLNSLEYILNELNRRRKNWVTKEFSIIQISHLDSKLMDYFKHITQIERILNYMKITKILTPVSHSYSNYANNKRPLTYFINKDLLKLHRTILKTEKRELSGLIHKQARNDLCNIYDNEGNIYRNNNNEIRTVEQNNNVEIGGIEQNNNVEIRTIEQNNNEQKQTWNEQEERAKLNNKLIEILNAGIDDIKTFGKHYIHLPIILFTHLNLNTKREIEEYISNRIQTNFEQKNELYKEIIGLRNYLNTNANTNISTNLNISFSYQEEHTQILKNGRIREFSNDIRIDKVSLRGYSYLCSTKKGIERQNYCEQNSIEEWRNSDMSSSIHTLSYALIHNSIPTEKIYRIYFSKLQEKGLLLSLTFSPQIKEFIKLLANTTYFSRSSIYNKFLNRNKKQSNPKAKLLLDTLYKIIEQTVHIKDASIFTYETYIELKTMKEIHELYPTIRIDYLHDSIYTEIEIPELTEIRNRIILDSIPLIKEYTTV